MGKSQVILGQEHPIKIAAAHNVEKSECIPRLFTLRRIAPQYRNMLPLPLMKQYQCIVVSGERGILTVAITNTNSTRIVTFLRTKTGCSIFPVLVEPERMRLLLRRAEWSEFPGKSVKRNKPLLHPLLMHSLLPLLS